MEPYTLQTVQRMHGKCRVTSTGSKTREAALAMLAQHGQVVHGNNGMSIVVLSACSFIAAAPVN